MRARGIDRARRHRVGGTAGPRRNEREFVEVCPLDQRQAMACVIGRVWCRRERCCGRVVARGLVGCRTLVAKIRTLSRIVRALVCPLGLRLTVACVAGRG
jgi:hypothetical protein